MKLLMTMNMPSASGYMVHQITVDTDCQTLRDFYRLMNEQEFVFCRLFYRMQNPFGETEWEDKGDMIINTAHIGKVQEYIERESNYESFGNSDERGSGIQKARPNLRPRRNVL